MVAASAGKLVAFVIRFCNPKLQKSLSVYSLLKTDSGCRWKWPAWLMKRHCQQQGRILVLGEAKHPVFFHLPSASPRSDNSAPLEQPVLLGQEREENQKPNQQKTQTMFILNFSQASRSKLSMDKDWLTTNIMVCCNYVKFTNRNRTSNHARTRWKA